MRLFVHMHDSTTGRKLTREIHKSDKVNELVNRLMRALRAVGAIPMNLDEEAGHTFHGNQWTGGLGTTKPDYVKTKGVKAGVHELLSSGHVFTIEELQKITGAKTAKLIQDALAMLKNPKYAGAAGTLDIVKVAGGFAVRPKASAPPAPPPVAAPPPPPPAPPPPPPREVAPLAPPRVTASASGTIQSTAPTEKRFAKADTKDIDSYMRQKHGVGFHNGSEILKDHKVAMKMESNRYWAMTPEERLKESFEYSSKTNAMRNEAYAVARAHPASNLRGHNQVDITKSTASAKAQRKMLGHIDDALDQLEESGFDVKKAFSKGNVSVMAGTPTKALGHAWQSRMGLYGYTSFAHGKMLGEKASDSLKNAATRRAMKGHAFTVGSNHDEKEYIRSTVVHELAHALGMQPHIDSPGKLSVILSTLDRQMANEHGHRNQWITKNISEYARTNIKETDAELAAMVTSPHYVRGTLPKALEDHVDWLFERKHQ